MSPVRSAVPLLAALVLLALAANAAQAEAGQPLAEADWYAWTPSSDHGPSVIGFEDWLDKPAGKHGPVKMAGDHLEFADGQRVKFWGTNLCYTSCCPATKKDAEATAARFAKYGINAVRLHKFTYPNGMGIGDPSDCTQMTEKGLDHLDYFAQQLRDRGIYYGWSHTYGFTVVKGDAAKLLAYDEIIRWQKTGTTGGLINYAEDVQDLLIEMVTNLLKHKNPYTGLTYAEDPALAYIELQNEDDIFWFSTEGSYQKCPTYRKKLNERYAEWLTAKYGSDGGLAAAWGEALPKGQTLAAKNVAITMNPWYSGSDNLPKKGKNEQKRLLDNAAFLHAVQDTFYSRFTKAIRDAGYKGALCGSPWQAPAMVPHYYNLESDSEVGLVDRHNYFDGLLHSMMGKPGSGYLSSGLQQVIDRPFALSEWTHVYPNIYVAEGPPLMAAYGMGLQGWDASYEFQSQLQSANGNGDFGTSAGAPPWGVWNVDLPTQLGQYPALARMIARGDVKEGEVISVRRVSKGNLESGTFDFTDVVKQEGDVKSFSGGVPTEALAAGRVVVEFSDKGEPSTLPDMAKYTSGEVITSITKQLRWDQSDKGHVTIDTDGTKGVVGFAGGKRCELGDVIITVETPWASVLLTSLERGKSLATTKRALVTATARIANTGFTYVTGAKGAKIAQNGKGPILCEPVKATFAIARRRIAAVKALDQDGRETARAVAVDKGTFTIDEAADKTIWYVIEFE
jgi:hypothetical protein